MQNILICYYGKYPTRTTIIDHLYSFARYSGQRCFYLDLATQKVTRRLLQIPFSLIIFHTVFFSARWNPEMFEAIVKRVRPLKHTPAVKVAIPQDEFYRTSVVCDFINEFGVEHVFSAAAPSEWGKMYRTVDFSKVKFHQVLTGYLEKRTLERISQIEKAVRDRKVEIGYRAWRAEPWLGRHGYLKTQLAEVFQQEAVRRGIKTDISTRAEDTLHGDAWYKFLFNCKYTIGVEGGASIIDWDGSVREITDFYMVQHPKAKFEEVEAACFPGLEGSLSLFAISPRHLEACATRTCQVLIEGDYNDVLHPGRHYIELKRDFSNLEDVFAQMGNETLRMKLAENAYRDVVESGNYLYASFVEHVLKTALGADLENLLPQTHGTSLWFAWQWGRVANLLAWARATVRGLVLVPVYHKAIAALPNSLVSYVESLVKKVIYK